MKIDCPGWPPGVVTKNSINMKMTISQAPFVEIDPTLVPECFLYKAVLIFLQFGIPSWPPFAIS